MGRPLNSRFFDPVPSSNGEGVASYTITNPGSYTSKPTATVSAPGLPGGVAATLGTISMKALSAAPATSGTGAANASYAPGDVLTLAGTTGTAATFNIVNTLVRTFGVDTQGTTVWTTGDTITFGPGGGWTSAATITITAAAGAITGTSNIVPGVYNGASDNQGISPTSVVVADGAGYQNDSVFSLGMGVNAVTLASAGNMTVIPANPAATTTDSATGTGATLTVAYGVLNVPVASSGSGYVSAADAALAFSPASTTASTAVLTSTGTNVILAHAHVVGGTTALDADIVKQTSTSDYVMTTTEGTSICGLVPSNTPAAGQAYIIATDSAANTYWVLKLTAHKAVLRRRAGGTWIYPNGYSAPWTLAPASGAVVSIESA